MLLFASYHYSERTRVTDWWRKTPDKSVLSTSVFVAFLLSYSLTLRQLRSYSLTWGSCSYSVTSNNRKRLLKIAQCEPGFTLAWRFFTGEIQSLHGMKKIKVIVTFLLTCRHFSRNSKLKFCSELREIIFNLQLAIRKINICLNNFM